MPLVDVSETGKEVLVNAEVPGMDPKDIDISLNCMATAAMGTAYSYGVASWKNSFKESRAYRLSSEKEKPWKRAKGSYIVGKIQ
jgi:hypothetical protein